MFVAGKKSQKVVKSARTVWISDYSEDKLSAEAIEKIYVSEAQESITINEDFVLDEDDVKTLAEAVVNHYMYIADGILNTIKK